MQQVDVGRRLPVRVHPCHDVARDEHGRVERAPVVGDERRAARDVAVDRPQPLRFIGGAFQKVLRHDEEPAARPAEPAQKSVSPGSAGQPGGLQVEEYHLAARAESAHHIHPVRVGERRVTVEVAEPERPLHAIDAPGRPLALRQPARPYAPRRAPPGSGSGVVSEKSVEFSHAASRFLGGMTYQTASLFKR